MVNLSLNSLFLFVTYLTKQERFTLLKQKGLTEYRRAGNLDTKDRYFGNPAVSVRPYRLSAPSSRMVKYCRLPLNQNWHSNVCILEAICYTSMQTCQ